MISLEDLSKAFGDQNKLTRIIGRAEATCRELEAQFKGVERLITRLNRRHESRPSSRLHARIRLLIGLQIACLQDLQYTRAFKEWVQTGPYQDAANKADLMTAQFLAEHPPFKFAEPKQ